MSHERSCIWTGCKPAEIWPLPWGVNLFSFPLGCECLLPLAPGKLSVVLNLHEVSNSYESRPHIPFSLKKGIPVVGFNHSFVLLFNFVFHIHNIKYRVTFLFSNFNIMLPEDNSDWISYSKIRFNGQQSWMILSWDTNVFLSAKGTPKVTQALWIMSLACWLSHSVIYLTFH